MLLQDGIEERLRDPDSSFGTVRRPRGRVGGRGMIEARDLVADHGRGEDVVARVVARKARAVAHLVGDTPAPQMLAGARIDEVGGGELDAAVALLNDETLDTAPAELGGERKAGRPAA